MATTAARLQLVRDAIDAIATGGQSVRYGERMVTKADLGELRRLEQQLAAEVTSQSRSGRNRVIYVVPE